MVVKAKVSFAGAVCMGRGEVRDIGDEAVLKDLLAAGYVAAVETEKQPKKKGKANEGQ